MNRIASDQTARGMLPRWTTSHMLLHRYKQLPVTQGSPQAVNHNISNGFITCDGVSFKPLSASHTRISIPVMHHSLGALNQFELYRILPKLQTDHQTSACPLTPAAALQSLLTIFPGHLLFNQSIVLRLQATNTQLNVNPSCLLLAFLTIIIRLLRNWYAFLHY